jgi:hypothetical protein
MRLVLVALAIGSLSARTPAAGSPSVSGVLDLVQIGTNNFKWSSLTLGPLEKAMSKSQIEKVLGLFQITPTGEYHMDYCGGYFHGDANLNGYSLHMAFYNDMRIEFLRVSVLPGPHDPSLVELHTDFEKRFPRAQKRLDRPNGKEAVLYIVDKSYEVYLEKHSVSLFLVGED